MLVCLHPRLAHISTTHGREPMDEAPKFVDRHLQQIRWLIVGVGVTGLVVIARSVRLATRFTTVASIPSKFFAGQLSLHGKVHNVEPNGRLFVEHIPIVRLPFSKGAGSGLLEVKLACVEQTDRSVQWMQKQLPTRPVFFQLMGVEGSDVILSHVKFQKFPVVFSSLNVHLVKEDLASVIPYPVLLGTPYYDTLYQNMRRAQERARKTPFWGSWWRKKRP